MMATGKINGTGKIELGDKLANFRKKLARGIGQKKITQIDFGEMFGGYSGRSIASYELADSEIPVALLYAIWKAGLSVDRLFAEGDFTPEECSKARALYDQNIRARVASFQPDERAKMLAVIKERKDAKATHDSPSDESPVVPSGKRKGSHSTSGKDKKR